MKTLWNTSQPFFGVLLLLLFMGCSGSSSTSSTSLSIPTDPSAAKEGQEGSDALPQTIIDAVNQELPNGTIVAATKEEEKGEISYDVEVEVDGKKFEVEVAEDGTVIEVEEDDDADEDNDVDEDGDADDDDDADEEIEVAVDQLPQAVTDAVVQAVPGGTIVEAEMETEDGQNVYDVEVEVGGKEFGVEVTEDGTVLEVEEEDADDIDDDDIEEENENQDDDDATDAG